MVVVLVSTKTLIAIHPTNFGLMLGQRRRRWPNIKPTLDRRLCLKCGVELDKGVQ